MNREFRRTSVAVVDEYDTRRFFVCWWYRKGVRLTSKNGALERQRPSVGPRMVRILVRGADEAADAEQSV